MSIAVVERAVALGATLVQPVADQFYGDRGGKLLDPFGQEWRIAMHREGVPGGTASARGLVRGMTG